MADVAIKDLTYENPALSVILAGSVLIQDIANSSALVTAAKLPTAANQVPLGIAMEPAQLDSAGNVRANSGVTVRIWGRATAVCASAIAIGDHVGIANAAGQVATTVQAIAGAQPKPVLGIAQTATTALGQGVEVLLTPGATW